MNEWLASHWYLLAAVLLAAVCVFMLWWSATHQAKDNSRSLLSLLLVWPLIFEHERNAKVKTRRLFVIFGIVVALLLVAVGIVINPGRG
jgi:flagellar basal body-associated protein FliL